MPWESGLRVRFGKKVTVMKPGVYLKIPIVDNCYVQTTRLRVITLPVQTLTTLDGKTISLVASGGYSIDDIYKLYNTLFHPEATIINIVMGSIAEYIATSNYEQCTPSQIENNVNGILQKKNDHGLANLEMRVIGFAIVKTYRLIQDGHYINSGESLNRPVGAPS